jgi:hypothetical protein
MGLDPDRDYCKFCICIARYLHSMPSSLQGKLIHSILLFHQFLSYNPPAYLAFWVSVESSSKGGDAFSGRYFLLLIVS